MVGVNLEAGRGGGLLNCCHRRRRDGVREFAAPRAQNVVVAIYAPVEAAGMVPERQLQDDAVVGQGVQGVVDGGEGDARQDGPHPLEDVGGAGMVVAGADGVENGLPLRGHP